MGKPHSQRPRRAARHVFLAAAALLAGCASYAPRPLPSRIAQPSNVGDIRVDAARMPLASLRTHRFDPSDGLDMDEVAMLSVANNPQLRAARDAVGVARAQAYAAGLLPDPQLGVTRDVPTNGGPGNTSAFSLGLSEDVSALLTRSVARSAAEAHAREVHLNLLWQEWQVVSQARLLFVRNLEQERLLRLLQENRELFAARYRRARAALREGNATIQAASADLVALQGVERQIAELERQIEHNRLQLNLLLGLAAGTKLHLVGGVALPPLDAARIRAELPQLAMRRPDLLALRAGYESQEQRFRQAVLGQFPALNVGLTHARDTSDIYTLGIGITLTLPIFNGNRGNIAIERATRRRLYDEYRARLQAADSEVRGILIDQRLLHVQLEGAERSIAELERVAAGAGAAYRAGNLSELEYVNLRAGLLAKRIEAVTLEQNLLEQRVALQTLVGTELPVKNKLDGTRK
ncbi:MAG: TolC family protein [Betaproteobacteria bacterium]|nr:TolC family protein [Betaproteobacteria bacterium]